MNLMKPHCRDRLNDSDRRFIASVLSKTGREETALLKLIETSDVRDDLLDKRRLFRAIIEWHKTLLISSYLYFYVLVRNLFIQGGIQDREIADYVATLLAEYSLQNIKIPGAQNQSQSIFYWTDILPILEKKGETEAFLLKTEIGNLSLLFTGVFFDFLLRRKEQRAAPGLEYYEQIGQWNYKSAGEHKLAGELQVGSLYSDLSSQFHDMRLSLNKITREYLYLMESPAAKQVRQLLRDSSSR